MIWESVAVTFSVLVLYLYPTQAGKYFINKLCLLFVFSYFLWYVSVLFDFLNFCCAARMLLYVLKCSRFCVLIFISLLLCFCVCCGLFYFWLGSIHDGVSSLPVRFSKFHSTSLDTEKSSHAIFISGLWFLHIEPSCLVIIVTLTSFVSIVFLVCVCVFVKGFLLL